LRCRFFHHEEITAIAAKINSGMRVSAAANMGQAWTG
jgi:hypothetical protein